MTAGDDATGERQDEAGPGAGAEAPTEHSASSRDQTSQPIPSDANPTSGVESADESDAIDPVPLGEPQRLDPAVRYYWVVGSLVSAAMTTVVVLLFTVVLNETLVSLPVTTVGGTAFVLLAVVGVVRSVLRFRSWSYVVREESLFLKRGVVTHVQTVVPYVRVQHIDTRRGAVERLFGLSSLVVYTAGSRGADVTVPGLTPDRANSLQSRLKRLAIESEEEDAV